MIRAAEKITKSHRTLGRRLPASVWRKAAPRLEVACCGPSCHLELACGKEVLWSGGWEAEVTVDGSPAAPTSPWSETCWLSDKKVDYLELAIELGDGLRIERQLVLARKDRFLILADAILGPRSVAIEYRGVLPLGPGINFREACESREGVLMGRKPRAMILPLALPEWLADRRSGQLRQTTAGLELRQSAQSRAMFAPLFFDLDRRRMFEPLTWRRLTVADSWTVQPDDIAVGHRVAIGKRQWVVYRSLAAARNRTLLGHNLCSETLVARFNRKGRVKPLVEIDAPARPR